MPPSRVSLGWIVLGEGEFLAGAFDVNTAFLNTLQKAFLESHFGYNLN